jgi:hypothetical protein
MLCVYFFVLRWCCTSLAADTNTTSDFGIMFLNKIEDTLRLGFARASTIDVSFGACRLLSLHHILGCKMLNSTDFVLYVFSSKYFFAASDKFRCGL